MFHPSILPQSTNEKVLAELLHGKVLQPLLIDVITHVKYVNTQVHEKQIEG